MIVNIKKKEMILDPDATFLFFLLFLTVDSPLVLPLLLGWLGFCVRFLIIMQQRHVDLSSPANVQTH